MKPSKYQQGVLNWIAYGTGNATCNAVAGSGKTTTLKLAAQKLRSLGFEPKDIKVIVFNKQNSLDLIEKFGREWKYSIQTLHSVGFRMLQQEIGKFRRDERVVNYKYRRIAEDWKLIPKRTKRRLYKGSLNESKAISRTEHFLKLIDLARLTLSDLSVESISQIANHHNLDGIHNFRKVSKAIARILLHGQEQAINSHRIDFTDMIWLPVEWALNEKSWWRSYKWVLTDECQDLNAAQLELSLMLKQDSGRMLYVGDPRQSIYGFSGADNRSYHKIVERTQAKELPLSLCYRCPRSHLDLVNRIYPDIPIEAAPNAIEGTLEQIDKNCLWDEEHAGHLVVGDMVLSRKTAPLVSLCIRLIGQGIAATVKGKDIGKQIKQELDAIADMTGFRYDEFNLFANQYREFKFQTYEGLDNAEQLKENLADKLNALTTIYSSQPNANCIAHLCNYIDDLFSDEESPITLSTVHRAKGLEGDRVFIIKPEDMPMVWESQKQWQQEQEDNLLYVALTRSKSILYIVGKPSWFKSDRQENEKAETATQETFAETSNENSAIDSEVLETFVTESAISATNNSVNSLHFGNTSELDVSKMMLLISRLFNYEDKCELLALLTEEVNQSKRNKVLNCLIQNVNRSDRAIASECQVSAPFVGKIRKNAIASGQIQPEVERVDKRGGKQNSILSKR